MRNRIKGERRMKEYTYGVTKDGQLIDTIQMGPVKAARMKKKIPKGSKLRMVRLEL